MQTAMKTTAACVPMRAPRAGAAACGLRKGFLPRLAVRPAAGARAGRSLGVRVAAVAEMDKTGPAGGATPSVTVDNTSDAKHSIISVNTKNRPGLLLSLTTTFRDLNLDVQKAVVDYADTEGNISDQFFVTDTISGGQVTDPERLDNIKTTLAVVLRQTSDGATIRPWFGTADTNKDSKKELLKDLQDTYLRNDVLSIQESIVNHVEYTLARSRYEFDDMEAYRATAHSLRDRLIEAWNDTHTYFREQDPKRVYYLSMEFLMGRSLTNCLNNLAVKNQYAEALRELGYNLETLVDLERDAALGNGGLGRLAACFLDSMATLNLPGWGYGLRYQYGMFRQSIRDGFQHEQPDYWLTFGNPWEIERQNVTYPVKFYGHVSVHDEGGRQVFRWNAGEQVTAVAYDNPIPGFNTSNTNNLRLWSAKPERDFDLEAFNTGDYVQAILSKQRAETISSVLYPDDRTYEGKELRLKQQNFFVSATIQDVVRRYKERHDDNFAQFADKAAFQLNDTHPTIAVPELMRVLMDENGLGWTRAWELTTQVFAFTNHTVLPEALEKWPVSLLEKLLPRHMQIIYDINWRFLQQLRSQFGDDWEKISRMSIIEDTPNGEKVVRMAYLAVVASHTVNGVAAIHSEIIKDTIFKDFYEMWPDKFQNKTNGVTQRRWLAFCNEPLRNLITSSLGTDEWITELDLLTGLRQFADDPEFQAKWMDVKAKAKGRCAAQLETSTGIKVRSDALFDVQIKRIHEYKRQLLNVLYIIHRYDQIKHATPEERAQIVPRVCIVGGKAAPGYEMAKRIIKLVCAVGDKVNNDPEVGDLLKVVFYPDYNVSSAEVLIPAADLSQHISTAGTEASGTSNMKFAMNGSLIIGTMDGANVEIAEEIGEENMFIFGALASDVERLREERPNFKPDPLFEHVCGMIRSNHFGWADYFNPLLEIMDGQIGGDFYLVANDFPAYVAAQNEVDAKYRDQAAWAKMSIMSVAGSGKFSSDRTIKEYAKDIWGIDPCPVPDARG